MVAGGELDEGVYGGATNDCGIEEAAAAFSLTCGGHVFLRRLKRVAGVKEQVLQDGAEGQRGEER